ncbi:MAG: EamA family transporter [Alphaproteobacteria bacterium]
MPLAVLYLLANRYMPRYEDGFTLFSFDIGTNLWISFLVYSLLIYTPANVLVFFNNKNVPAGIIGMILLLEPVTGITLDIVFLHNPLTWNIIVGGVIILAANIVLILKNSSMACRRHTAAFKMLSEKKSYSSSASSIRD